VGWFPPDAGIGPVKTLVTKRSHRLCLAACVSAGIASGRNPASRGAEPRQGDLPIVTEKRIWLHRCWIRSSPILVYPRVYPPSSSHAGDRELPSRGTTRATPPQRRHQRDLPRGAGGEPNDGDGNASSSLTSTSPPDPLPLLHPLLFIAFFLARVRWAMATAAAATTTTIPASLDSAPPGTYTPPPHPILLPPFPFAKFNTCSCTKYPRFVRRFL
jgi:hypothetical protein